MTVEQLALRRPGNRVRLFIDFWNLQLTLNDREREATGAPDPRFPIDWKNLPSIITTEAASKAGLRDFSFEGAMVYVSYVARATDASFRQWLRTFWDRQPGIQVVAKERGTKRHPICPNCRTPMAVCPNCNTTVNATVEKGVDTALATDMIRLAWEDSYDIGVIVSLDSDFVPVVQFLDAKGRKMIQAGFPPQGSELAAACWASIDLFSIRERFSRQSSLGPA